MTVRVDADGAIELLDEISARLLDLSPVFAVIASDLAAFIGQSFDSATAPSGRPWQPLAPVTIKKRRQGSSTPLIDTGLLRGSITAESSATSIAFGTNIPYAEFHQWGTVHIPARPFVPVTFDGELVTDGPSGEEWQRYEEMVATFIETGEILQG